MCGICGAFAGTTITKTEQEKVMNLLFMNTMRGRDSTGMFDFVEISTPTTPINTKKGKKKQIDHTENAVCLHWKTLLPAYQFSMETMPHVSANRWTQHVCRLIVCHARAATVGDITKNNAHPFVSGNLIGVHNGTISGEFEGKKDKEVDSHAMLDLIQKHGPKDAIQKMIDTATNTAYALVWMDMDTNKVFFLRNHQRPLAYYETGGTVYFSSDKKDIAYVFKISDLHIGIHEFKPETLYTLDLNKKDLKMEETPMNFTRKVYESTVYPFRGTGAYRGDAEWAQGRGPYGILGEALNDDWDGSEYENPLLIATRESQSTPEVFKTTLNIKHEPRDHETYKGFWKMKTWDMMERLGYAERSTTHEHYDIAFGKYFPEFVFSMIQLWKKDHKPAYDKMENVVWKEMSPQMRRLELARCTFPPHHLLPSRPVVLPEVERAKSDLIFPFGVEDKMCSESMFKEKTKDGCAHCQNDVEPHTAPYLFWFDNESFLCEACQWTAAYDEEHPTLSKMVNAKRVEEWLDKTTKLRYTPNNPDTVIIN